MTDFIVHHQALIREVINGYAMILCLTLSMMVGVFMWDSIVDWYGHPRIRATRSWHEVPGIQTACALWWIFIAESYRTGAVWMLYQIGKHEHDVSIFFDGDAYWSSYGYLLAGTILNVGLLRAIYIFTPPEWKNRVWIYASLGGVMFCSIPALVLFGIRIYLNGF